MKGKVKMDAAWKKYIHHCIKPIASRLIFPIPQYLSKNQIQIGNEGLEFIKKSIKENYHKGWRNESNYSKIDYQNDLDAHLYLRLDNDRRLVIPWLDSAKTLKNSRILEVGCGTGSSTVSLAEQGAKVTGIDLDEGAISVAKDRCRVYNLECEFQIMNANMIARVFDNNTFDYIIFYATLEHMSIEERIKSLRDAWGILPKGGLLAVVETPNRLWYFDRHTSWLPFFHWLPDELAFQYSCFSPRVNYHELYREYDTISKDHFTRRGRGMSYHEFDLAIKPTKYLKVISSLSTFYKYRYKLIHSKKERKYKSFLMSVCPDIHEGFFEVNLNLILEK